MQSHAAMWSLRPSLVVVSVRPLILVVCLSALSSLPLFCPGLSLVVARAGHHSQAGPGLQCGTSGPRCAQQPG